MTNPQAGRGRVEKKKDDEDNAEAGIQEKEESI